MDRTERRRSRLAGAAAGRDSIRLAPTIEIARGAKVYVIGDSISAGLDEGRQTWPQMLADDLGIEVINLARADAGATDARVQAESIVGPESIVLVRALDELLETLRAKRCRVYLFELPLPPFGNAYARAQRELARQHGAALIPKHHFTKILRLKGATSDGLHLTPEGMRPMAAMVGDHVVLR